MCALNEGYLMLYIVLVTWENMLQRRVVLEVLDKISGILEGQKSLALNSILHVFHALVRARHLCANKAPLQLTNH